jgi:predicted MFS family arabinose efflux permease
VTRTTGRHAAEVTTAETAAGATDESAASGVWSYLQPVRSLRHRQFRYLWLGQLATTNGLWMDQITRGWLVYQLTGSAAQLAVASAVRSLPLLFFGLVAGVLADRWDRKRLLMAAQGLNVVLNLALAALILTGLVEVWQVYVTGFLSGIGQAVQQPARQSMLPALVPRTDLQNAVVLNSGILNIAQAVGPALGGVLVASVGMGWTYVAQAGLFVAGMAATAVLVTPPLRGRQVKESMLAGIAGGLRYVRGNSVLLALLLLALVPMFFGSPYTSLVPLFAAEILDAGPQATGMLLAATGFGSIVSLIVLASAPPLPRMGRVLVVGAVLYGVSICLFAVSTVFFVSFVLLFLAGVTRGAYRTMNHTMLLAETEDAFLGRVNSIYLLDRGLVPLGTLILGLMATLIGASAAVFIMGSACAVLSLASVAVSRRLWRA